MTQPTQPAQPTQPTQPAQPAQPIQQQPAQFSFDDAANTARKGAESAFNAVNNFSGTTTAAPGDPNDGMPVLSAGEFVVRHYQCSAIKHPRVNGFLTLTNRRLIFHGKSSSSRIVRDIPIDQVDGFDSFYGMNLKIFRIIIGVIAVIAGLVMLATFMPWSLLLILLGIVLVITGIKRSYYLTVRVGDPGGRFELGSAPESMVGNGSVYALASDPGPDVDRMLGELGALLIDLKSGDPQAIERWGRQ